MKTIRKNKRNTKREKKSRKKSNKHKNTRRKNIKKNQRAGMMGVLQPSSHPEPELDSSVEAITQDTDILKFFREEDGRYKLRDTVNIISAHGSSLEEFIILPWGLTLYLTSSAGEVAKSGNPQRSVKLDRYIRMYRGGSVIQNIELNFSPFYFDDSGLVKDNYTPRGLLNYEILHTKLSTPVEKKNIHPFLVHAVTSRRQDMNTRQHEEAISAENDANEQVLIELRDQRELRTQGIELNSSAEAGAEPEPVPEQEAVITPHPDSTYSRASFFYAIKRTPVYSVFYPTKQRVSLSVNRRLEIGEVVEALQTMRDDDGDIQVKIPDGWIIQNGMNGPNIKRIRGGVAEVEHRIQSKKREHLQRYKDEYFKDNDESIIHSNELIESLINGERYKLSDVLRNIVDKKGVNESKPEDWFGLFCRSGKPIDITKLKKCKEKEFEAVQGVDLPDNVFAHYTQHNELDDPGLFRQTSLSSSHYLTRFMENVEYIHGYLESEHSPRIDEEKSSRFNEIYANKIRGKICPVLTKSDICFILQLHNHIELENI